MNKVTVKIYGRNYIVTGEQSEEEILKIAEHVDSEIKEIARTSSYVPMADLGVLAALNISEQLFARHQGDAMAKMELDESREEKIKELQNMVDEYETNFFDLQMENIKLKNELEKLKGNL